MVVDAGRSKGQVNTQTRLPSRERGREDTYELAVEALREEVVNALMGHAPAGPLARGTQVQVEMYPDRLLIRNPGGLFGAVSEDELGTEGVSSSRGAVHSGSRRRSTSPTRIT